MLSFEYKILKNSDFIPYLINQIHLTLTITRNELTLPSFISQLQKEQPSFLEIKISIHLDCIKNAITFLKYINNYKENFKNTYIAKTVQFYTTQVKTKISELTFDEYQLYFKTVFQIEKIIINKYLSQSLSLKLIPELQLILVKSKTNEIMNKYYNINQSQENRIVFNEKFFELKQIYELFSSFNIEKSISTKYKEYITSLVNKIYLLYSNNYVDLINWFFKLSKHILEITSTSFKNSSTFLSINKDLFSKTINLKSNLVANYLSRYIHLSLTSENTSIQLNTETMNDIMNIFKHLECKDLFQKYFLQQHANRTIYGIKTDLHKQNLIIDQIQKECGDNYINQSVEMIDDISISKEISNEYKTKHGLLNDTNYFILNSTSWPIDESIQGGYINENIEKTFKEFVDYYKIKQKGKVFNLYLPYCNGEMVFDMNKTHNEIVIRVNGVHAAILSCFTKNCMKMYLKDIVKNTKLDKAIILKYIADITKSNLLSHDNKNGEDMYSFNSQYESLDGNNYINLIDLSINKNDDIEKEEVEERIIEERKLIIDAYIIKIIKPHKSMLKNELISKVKDSLKFKTEIEVIETRIKLLLENGYIYQKDNKDLILY